MGYHDLRHYMQTLEAIGELKRVRVEVDPRLEIAEITSRVCKLGGPALLFESVKGSHIPVITNLFGSQRRMEKALEVDRLEDISERVVEWLELPKSGRKGLGAKLAMLPKLAELNSYHPKTVKKAPVQEVVELGSEARLSQIPVLTCWPLDAGPFITLPMVVTRDPEAGDTNIGMYRVQVFDDHRAGCTGKGIRPALGTLTAPASRDRSWR